MRGLSDVEFEVLQRRATNAPYGPTVSLNDECVVAADAMTERGLLRRTIENREYRWSATDLGRLALRCEMAVRRGTV